MAAFINASNRPLFKQSFSGEVTVSPLWNVAVCAWDCGFLICYLKMVALFNLIPVSLKGDLPGD